MVLVCVGGSSIDNDVGLDLLDYVLAVSEFGDISNMVCDSLEFVLERRAAHDGD